MRARSAATALAGLICACGSGAAAPNRSGDAAAIADVAGQGGFDDAAVAEPDAAPGVDVAPAGPAPDLSISISANTAGPTAIGEVIVFRFDYQNDGDGEAGGAVITASVPVGASFDSAGAPGSSWSCSDGAVAHTECHTILPATLGAGASGSVELAVHVISEAGTILQRAQIAHTAGAADSDPADNAATAAVRTRDVVTTITLGRNEVLAVPLGPDRTALYADEPPGTPPNVAQLVVPGDFAGDRDLPMILMLHGLDGSSGAISGHYGHRWATFATTRGYFVLLPNGTLGPNSRRHWNATDVCCDRAAGFPNRDDVGYLRDLILEAQQKYHVDPARVYVLGFSNGGYMAYRLACEIPEMIAAIVPVAGATFQDEMSCASVAPISILHIHGTADEVVRFHDMDYDHDRNPATPPIDDRTDVPGALQTLSRFAAKAGCDPDGLEPAGNINIWHPHARTDPPDPPYTIGEGDETTVHEYAGCDAGYRLTLWEIEDGTHSVNFEYDLSLISDGLYPNERIYNWMLEHQAP